MVIFEAISVVSGEFVVDCDILVYTIDRAGQIFFSLHDKKKMIVKLDAASLVSSGTKHGLWTSLFRTTVNQRKRSLSCGTSNHYSCP